jgi:hypothetical protein
LALDGKTSLEEVLAVTHSEETTAGPASAAAPATELVEAV